MFAWGYLGKLSVQERAKRDIEQHERDLYDAEKNLALWQLQVKLHHDEIVRLTPLRMAGQA